jgi:hypothetical protein
MFGDEAWESMDHGQPLITRGHTATTRLLQVLQEKSQALGHVFVSTLMNHLT